MINDLKERLKNHRKWTPPLENIGFQYGFNTNQLDSWVAYWAEKYNFQEREKFFNKYPQFKTNIQGLDIHFIRVKPEVCYETKMIIYPLKYPVKYNYLLKLKLLSCQGREMQF